MPRELAILFALNQIQDIQEKEEVVTQAFMEAETKFSAKPTQPQGQTQGGKKGGTWEYLSRNTHSNVDYRLEFNDNIYGAEDKTSDFLNKIRLSTWTDIRYPRLSLNVGTNIESLLYFKNSQHDHYTVDIGLNGLKKMGNYDLLFSDRYATNFDSEMSGLGGTKRKFVEARRNNISLGLRRKFNRLGYELQYRYYIQDYESGYNDRDFGESTFVFSEFLRIAPKTSLMLEYQFGFIRHTYGIASRGDSDYNGINFGITGVLSGKLTGFFKWGYRNQEYRTAQDFSSVTLSGSLNYMLSQLTNLNFRLERTTYESSFSDQDYYVNNNFGLGGGHRFSFNKKLSMDFYVGLSHCDYTKRVPVQRNDEMYNLAVNLNYDFRKWLRFSFGYQFHSRRSNVEYNYDSNTFNFNTRASF